MKTPVAIIGGGPGGSSCAMFLARHGVPSVIIEKDAFPRYHIGESMTGECGNLVRALGLEQQMLAARHPQKQGVNVFGPTGRNPWFVPVMGRSPEGALFDASTWQVRRSDFDRMMHDEAMARGAEIVRGQAIAPIVGDDGAVRGVRVRMPDGAVQEILSEVLVDASGQLTFLAHQGVTGEKHRGRYDKQIALFSQVANPVRDRGERMQHPDNTLIFYKERYHWAWFIPLDDEVVSVGVVAPGAYFAGRKESRRDYLARELHELNPELTRRLGPVRLIEEARAIPNYSYHVKRFTGKGFICLGDSHRFIDPIFSFGLYVSMKEAQLAAPAIAEYLAGERRDRDNPFDDLQDRWERGLDNLQDLIDGFWGNPLGFARLVHASKWKPDVIDMFAGRIYMDEPSSGVLQMRGLAEHVRAEQRAMAS